MTHWIAGWSPIGKSSFGTALVAGRNLVPRSGRWNDCTADLHGSDDIFWTSMPTYVYKFVDSGETIEVQQGFHDDTLTEVAHPETGEVKPVKKVFTPVGVTFKGSGFFKTDNRGKKSLDDHIVRLVLEVRQRCIGIEVVRQEVSRRRPRRVIRRAARPRSPRRSRRSTTVVTEYLSTASGAPRRR